MTTDSPYQLLEKSELLFSEHDVAQAVLAIAKQLNTDYANEPPVILSVMTGATVFTGHLIPKLTFPLELDYVQATRYEDGVEGKNLSWKVKPKSTIKNRSVLILDDILDEGITLKAIVDECLLLGAKEVKTAVLVEKKLSISKPVQTDCVGLIAPNRYIFGFGMDVYGWWRNLPAIYALKDT